MSALRQTKGAPRVSGTGPADLRRVLRHQAPGRNPVPPGLSLSGERARASAGRNRAPAAARFVARLGDDARLEPASGGAAVHGVDVSGSLRTAGTAADRGR